MKNADTIELDVEGERLDLMVRHGELLERSKEFQLNVPPSRGYARLRHEHVLQAHLGCDLDFLCPIEE